MTRLEQLQKCKMQLSLMQNIDNMRDYAASWLILSRCYRSMGLRSNYDYCRARGKYYSRLARLAGGEFVRLIDSPVVELIPVEATL